MLYVDTADRGRPGIHGMAAGRLVCIMFSEVVKGFLEERISCWYVNFISYGFEA